MTASPDRPSGTPRFVVDALAINPLKRESHHGRTATGPIKVWNFIPDPLRSFNTATHAVHLSAWPHAAPLSAHHIPTLTDLTRFLESGRWRFDLEHLPAEVGDFLDQPDAEGFQFDFWLDHQLHLPSGYAAQQEAVGNPPGFPRVMLFDVPAPDRLPEGSERGTETLSGVAEDFPDRSMGKTSLNLRGPELVTRQGKVFITHHPAPRAGLYDSWGDLDRSRVRL